MDASASTTASPRARPGRGGRRRSPATDLQGEAEGRRGRGRRGARRKPRKALCSLGAGPHAALLDLARQSFEPYAERHGYEFLLRDAVVDPERPPSWSRIAVMREAVDAYDLVLWLDADTVIVDPERDIAEELEDERDFYLVEHRYGEDRIPNSGVMLIRAGDEAMAFLDAVWSYNRFQRHPWREGAPFIDLMGYSLPGWLGPDNSTGPQVDRGPEAHLSTRPARPDRPSRFRDRTKFLPLEWNSTPSNPAPRPRIEHFQGLDLDKRIERMRAALSRAQQVEVAPAGG